MAELSKIEGSWSADLSITKSVPRLSPPTFIRNILGNISVHAFSLILVADHHHESNGATRYGVSRSSMSVRVKSSMHGMTMLENNKLDDTHDSKYHDRFDDMYYSNYHDM